MSRFIERMKQLQVLSDLESELVNTLEALLRKYTVAANLGRDERVNELWSRIGHITAEICCEEQEKWNLERERSKNS